MRYVISGVLKQSRQAWSGSQLPQLIKHLVLARPAGRMEVISGGCLLGGQLTPVQGYFRKKKMEVWFEISTAGGAHPCGSSTDDDHTRHERNRSPWQPCPLDST